MGEGKELGRGLVGGWLESMRQAGPDGFGMGVGWATQSRWGSWVW